MWLQLCRRGDANRVSSRPVAGCKFGDACIYRHDEPSGVSSPTSNGDAGACALAPSPTAQPTNGTATPVAAPHSKPSLPVPDASGLSLAPRGDKGLLNPLMLRPRSVASPAAKPGSSTVRYRCTYVLRLCVRVRTSDAA